MNESPEKHTSVWLGPRRLLFEGPLGQLDWHTHASACVLISTHEPIVGRTREQEVEAHVIFAPAGVEHALEFGESSVVTHYYPAHDPAFAWLRSSPTGELGAAERDASWSRALETWSSRRDAGALTRAALDAWAPDRSLSLDPRIHAVLDDLGSGRGVRDSVDVLARRHGISRSRLMHLVREQTGSTIGRHQLAARFWRAARAMLDASTFTEAAHLAEFADSAHFSRSFKQAYGLAPTRILSPQTHWELNESVG